MEIGEAIAVLTEGTEKCPFCGSTADPAPVEKEMINDSAKLAENCGGMPYRTLRHPQTDFDVFERYYVSEEVSRICFNAHHILPGNASLGKCPQVLEWMAGTVSIKKVFYDQPIQMKVRKVVASKRDSTRAKLVAAKFPDVDVPPTMFGDPKMRITFSTRSGKAGISRKKTVKTNKVFGKISFDVNDAGNGVWLPSNNAVDGWSLMAAEMVTPLRGGRDLPFHGAYAGTAMEVTKHQFHDAHEKYSDAVVDKLREVAQALRGLAEGCKEHENPDSKKDGKFRAPERLTNALYRLGMIIVREKLNLKSCGGKPAQPWVTSDLAATYGRKY